MTIIISCKENDVTIPENSVSHIIKNAQGISRDFLGFNLNYYYDDLGKIKTISGVESLRSIRCDLSYSGHKVLGKYDNLTTSEHRSMQIYLDSDSNNISSYQDEYAYVIFTYDIISGSKRLVLSYNTSNGDTLFAHPRYEEGNLVYCESKGVSHYLSYEGRQANIPGINTLSVILSLGKYDKIIGILPFSIGTNNAHLVTKDSVVGDRNYYYQYHYDAKGRIDFMLLNGTTTTFTYY